MPDQERLEYWFGLVLTGRPKLMPSLIFATSEGWELWGKKFTSLWGLFQLLTQQEKKMNSTYYPVCFSITIKINIHLLKGGRQQAACT